MKGLKVLELIIGLYLIFSFGLAEGVLRTSSIVAGILIVIISCIGLTGKAKIGGTGTAKSEPAEVKPEESSEATSSSE